MSGVGPYRDAAPRDPEEPEPDPRGPWVLQTWSSRRACVDCGVALFAARKEGYRIDACGACGGTWVSASMLREAVADRSLVPATLSDQASARATRSGSSAGPRACPDCSAALVATVVARRVAVDVCASHGAWFDPGELRAFIELGVRRRGLPDDAALDALIAEEALRGLRRPPENYEVDDRSFVHPGTALITVIELLVDAVAQRLRRG